MKAKIDLRGKGAKISRHIYGHFSEHLGRCIYGGYWVGEDSEIPNVRGIRSDIVEAMKSIKTPNIRWPGGCFADDYNWMDGIGPKDDRPPMVNTHWGGVLENNHFGTHEFMDLCEQIGCEPYICGNVGSGTVREMRNWVEYITDDGMSPMAQLRRKNGRDEAWGIQFFGIGNENWGCGGFMRPEYYADEFRKYATYVRNYKAMREHDWWKVPPIMKIAGGENAEKFEWTETLMRIAGKFMGGLSIHSYVSPGDEASGTEFTEKSWYQTAENTYRKEKLFQKNMSIMDYYDPEKRVALVVDEWGMWVNNEPDIGPGILFQQNTMRSAMCAALMLHMFQKYADRIRLCNLAQTINVLQSIILTEGSIMVKTPTYHIFDLFKDHQEAYHLPVLTEGMKQIEKGLPNADISASISENGSIYITIVNLSTEEDMKVDLDIEGKQIGKASGKVLFGKVNDHNTFENPNVLSLNNLDGIKVSKTGIQFAVPRCGIAGILLN